MAIINRIVTRKTCGRDTNGMTTRYEFLAAATISVLVVYSFC